MRACARQRSERGPRISGTKAGSAPRGIWAVEQLSDIGRQFKQLQLLCIRIDSKGHPTTVLLCCHSVLLWFGGGGGGNITVDDANRCLVGCLLIFAADAICLHQRCMLQGRACPLHQNRRGPQHIPAVCPTLSLCAAPSVPLTLVAAYFGGVERSFGVQPATTLCLVYCLLTGEPLSDICAKHSTSPYTHLYATVAPSLLHGLTASTLSFLTRRLYCAMPMWLHFRTS